MSGYPDRPAAGGRIVENPDRGYSLAVLLADCRGRPTAGQGVPKILDSPLVSDYAARVPGARSRTRRRDVIGGKQLPVARKGLPGFAFGPLAVYRIRLASGPAPARCIPGFLRRLFALLPSMKLPRLNEPTDHLRRHGPLGDGCSSPP